MDVLYWNIRLIPEGMTCRLLRDQIDPCTLRTDRIMAAVNHWLGYTELD